MATSVTETPAQFERDLRSANQDWKRSKDSNVKWSYGAKHPRWPSVAVSTEEEPKTKARPLGKQSDKCGMAKDKGNINKYARTTGRIHDIANSRMRSKVSMKEEMAEAASVSRSILDYLPNSPRGQAYNPMDNVLYSFDRADSPGRPLTLEVFVKTTGRDMEKFVEKEYEILDANGDALKGRKARRNLRLGATGSQSADDEAAIDADGFELV